VSLDFLANYGALATAAVAVVAYVWTQWRKPVGVAQTAEGGRTEAEAESEVDQRTNQRAARALALDAVSEAVLIVQDDGRVRDCNSAALALFQRHRASLQDVYVSTLRTLDEANLDAYRSARERGLWAGDSWARVPDGSVTLCLTRIVPLCDVHGRVTAFSESYRDVVSEQLAGQGLRDRLFGVRAALESPENAISAELSLSRLGASFRDLEVAVQQYERVIDALSMQDPVTESLAGLVHEVREATSTVTTQAVLKDIPELLATIRARLGGTNGQGEHASR
jgi:PAS domain-containing protein